MKHELLTELSDPIDSLLTKTLEVGVKVFDDEQNMTDLSILASPSSEFYGDKEKYVLAKMTFYLCSQVVSSF